ncbi:MAG: Crp/Fnr family transcriptional regulator [Oscillospiraceae bacterium]|nr:Crp/Fnr family transcriptional regulator [Oscillospiraceae bacterium]
MKKYIPILKRTRLFSGVGEEEIGAMLNCLQARLCTYKKGEYVLRQGEHTDTFMILAEGKLHIQCDDYWGNRSIINMVSAGEMFGEAYAAPESGAVMNDVLAVEDSVIILFDVKRIITVCPSACRFHSAVVQNMFYAISEKNRSLVQKITFMSKRTTREKLIAYLSEEAKRHNSSEFSIPFNRQQLADYLSVDRSAMSNELCKMRDEGMITFEKNRFVLYDDGTI